ncbi:MAG: pilus assembly protein TadG-related protein, partial [Alphaproteobacteria bacterium]
MTTLGKHGDDRAGGWQRRTRNIGRQAMAHLANFGKNQVGSIAILGALSLPVVIGGMVLGAEVGLWYQTQRQLQHAADTAAHGAGIRMRQGDSDNAVHD